MFFFYFRNLHTSRDSSWCIDNLINHKWTYFEILFNNLVEFQRSFATTTVVTVELLAKFSTNCTSTCSTSLSEACPTSAPVKSGSSTIPRCSRTSIISKPTTECSKTTNSSCENTNDFACSSQSSNPITKKRSCLTKIWLKLVISIPSDFQEANSTGCSGTSSTRSSCSDTVRSSSYWKIR